MGNLRNILKDIGETLNRLHAGLFIAGIGAVFALFNLDNLIKVTSWKEYIQLVLLWTSVLIVLSVAGELGVKYVGRGFIRLSEYYPNWYYFPKLGLSCQFTPKKEIELRIINHKFWQKISLRVEFYSVSEVKSSPSISGVSPPSYRELLPSDAMTGKDARTKIIGRAVEGGMVLSTGNKNEEVQITQPGLYDYKVNLFGKFRGRKYSGNGKVSLRITEKHEVIIEE